MRIPPPILWHYTCRDHGEPGIDRDRVLRPRRHPLLPRLGDIVWLTDLGHIASPELVGLTSRYLTCDRTAVRYAIESTRVLSLQWWPAARAACDARVVEDLECYGWPQRWWIARDPVPVWSKV